MYFLLSFLSQIAFPLLLISAFWFITYLFINNWLKDHFNTYIIIGIAWFVIFSSLVTFALTLSVRVYLSVPFFLLIAATAIYILFKFLVRGTLMNLSVRIGIWKTLVASIPFFLVFFLNNWGNNFAGSSYASLGTLHSAKYSYLSEYIEVCRKLPAIKNNVGQSMVVAFFSSSTHATATYLLFLVLVFSLLALAFLAYGLFTKHFPQSSNLDRVYALAIFTLGSYALSLAVPTINDSGNPLFFVGYSDSLVSIFYFFILTELLKESTEVPVGQKLFLLIPGTITLWVSSPQALILIPVTLLYLIYKKSWKNSLLVVSAFVTSLVVWRNQTGMLATLSKEIAIPGVAGDGSKLSIPSSFNELISPGLPYVVNSLDLKSSPLEIFPKGIDLFKSLLAEVQPVNGIPVIDPARLFWYSEQIFLATLRPVFWPVLGIVLFALICNTKFSKRFMQRVSYPESELTPTVSLIGLNLLVTFPLSFLIQFSGKKWEMSRFSFLNWAIGMFFISLLFIYFRIYKKFRAAQLIFIFTVIPTVLHLITRLAVNATGAAFSLDTPVGVIGVIQEVIRINCSY